MISNGDSSSGAKATESVDEAAAKKDRKAQKRIDKTVEQTLAVASEIDDVQERLLFVCRKHAEMTEDHKQITSQLRKLEARMEQLLREKTNLEGEQSKALLTRSRLEGLCRELQKQNKLIKEESVARIREEEEKRREVSAKFQTTLSDITGTMNENNQKNTRLAEENVEMSKKLKSLCEQYEQNNTLVEKMMKQKELESQLAEARMAKLQLQMNEEKRQAVQEKQTLLTEMSVYQKRCTDLQKAEMMLRQQLATYTDKYEEIQGALAKSNKVFGSFKSEMEKMQKNIRTLEKETLSWRSRWEGSNRSLLFMAEQKQTDDAKLLVQQKRIETLERLCRALQARGGGAELPLESEESAKVVLTEERAGVNITESQAGKPEMNSTLAAEVEGLLSTSHMKEASKAAVSLNQQTVTDVMGAPVPSDQSDSRETDALIARLGSLELQLSAAEIPAMATATSADDDSTPGSAPDRAASSPAGPVPLQTPSEATQPSSPLVTEPHDAASLSNESLSVGEVATAAPAGAACSRLAAGDSGDSVAPPGSEHTAVCERTPPDVSSAGDAGVANGDDTDTTSEARFKADGSNCPISPVI